MTYVDKFLFVDLFGYDAACAAGVIAAVAVLLKLVWKKIGRRRKTADAGQHPAEAAMVGQDRRTFLQHQVQNPL
jgi:membrane protein implicated in regulation of membrane protease activity